MQISFTTYFDLNLGQLRIQDTSFYGQLSDNVGILTVSNTKGVIYQGNFNTPDLSPASSLYSKYINLPKDNNGFVKFDTYTVSYQSKQISTGIISSETLTYTYDLLVPEIWLYQAPDGYNSVFTSQDKTDYGNYNSLTRTHSVTPPAGSGLTPIVTTDDTVSYPANIWSGMWNSIISTELEYLVNGLVVLVTLSKESSVFAYKVDMNAIRYYLDQLRLDFASFLQVNRAKAEVLKTKLLLIDIAYAEYNLALNYHDLFEAYNQAVNIIYQLSDYIPHEGVQEIYPFSITPSYVNFATVAISGNYVDLNGIPTIPAAQVPSDWNASSGVSRILNKPTIPAAQQATDWNAVSGVTQLVNKPLDLVHDADYVHTDNNFSDPEKNLLAQQSGTNTGDQDLSGLQSVSEKGQANGYVPLDTNTKIPSAYLPSYVDDVVEVSTYSSLPTTGESGKIYITIDTNKEYRWSGSIYVELTSSPGTTDNVPEGTTNKYFTTARVLATILSGLSTATNVAILAADSILVALGKLQAQINGILNDNTYTKQGNTFNGNSQLVKTTSDGKLPVIDGSNLTNITTGNRFQSIILENSSHATEYTLTLNGSNELLIKNNADVNIAKLDQSGNITVLQNVTALLGSSSIS